MTQYAKVEINFSELLSYKKLQGKELQGLKEAMSKPGVYIWGLIFQRQNDQPFGEPFDNTTSFNSSEHTFIPYYVGQSGTSLWNCFKQRHTNSLRNNLYLILSYDYIKEFYKDPFFPENIESGANKPRKWFIQNYFDSRIIYYNNYHILQHLYQLDCSAFPVQENYSTQSFRSVLEKVNKKEQVKLLDEYIHTFYKKLYFCYTTSKPPGLDHEDLESYIFYRLKGKTISKHKSFEKVKQRFSSLEINIPPTLGLFKDTISRCFCGYSECLSNHNS